MYVCVNITSEKPSIDKLTEELLKNTDRTTGAVATFIGFVKGVVDGKKVYKLIYSAYEPYASKSLEKIAYEEAEKHGLKGVIIIHRIGELFPGDPTIYILVAAKSRHEAFTGVRNILERVKHESYIYKLEIREDGEYWVLGDGKRIQRFKEQSP
ncbi:MAG: molybdenum cofactor biosynthesis protein MoaE [Staphylothermus sp.]|nr:molybdenum cofactor biosynthesis protein MoaE [Staphylothermus sp.]